MSEPEPGGKLGAKLAREDALHHMRQTFAQERKEARVHIIQRLRSDLAALGAQLDDLDELDREALRKYYHGSAKQTSYENAKSEVERLTKENAELQQKLAEQQGLKDRTAEWEREKKARAEWERKCRVLQAKVDELESVTGLLQRERGEARDLKEQYDSVRSELVWRTNHFGERVRTEVEKRLQDPKRFDELKYTRQLCFNYSKKITELNRALEDKQAECEFFQKQAGYTRHAGPIESPTPPNGGGGTPS